MTDYKTIRGKKIKFFTSDLSSAEAEGQIYYVNTSPGSVDTAGNFKTAVASDGWSSGGSLATARRYLAGAGTQTAALSAGGAGPGYDQIVSCFEYDGSSWTSGGNYPQGTSNVGIAGALDCKLAQQASSVSLYS